MHGIARRLWAHKTETAATLVATTAIFIAGILLKDYHAPATLHGIDWIVSPLVLFLNEGGTVSLAIKAVELGLACGFLVATLRHLRRRAQDVRETA
jgi:hypothetical protein